MKLSENSPSSAMVLPFLLMSACARPAEDVQNAVRSAVDQVYALPNPSCESAKGSITASLAEVGFTPNESGLSDGHYTITLETVTDVNAGLPPSRPVTFADRLNVTAEDEDGGFVIAVTAPCSL